VPAEVDCAGPGLDPTFFPAPRESPVELRSPYASSVDESRRLQADAALSERWSRYYAAAGGDPRPTLLAALERFEGEGAHRERLAVDLGCGTGRDTLELLRRGWRVLAIDAQIEAIDHLRQHEAIASPDRLQTLVADFESARWPSVALVNASYSLPFCSPDGFALLWGRIVGSLSAGGRFCGQLFGDHDEWASPPSGAAGGWSSPPGMTFHTRAEVEELLAGFEVEQLVEIDEDGTTAVGDAKHWHLFHVVARKLDD
jgi:SAM-dependent methyltransferase